MDDLTMAEFLDFELIFELVMFLGITVDEFKDYKNTYPTKCAQAAKYVLLNICSEACKIHILDKHRYRIGR